jgi:translation initiation factor 3 subunit F
MLALHLRANRKEVVVGWYASCYGAQEIADTSSLIHEFYASEVEESDPIHITVDTRLLEDSLKVRAYKSTPVLVQGEPLANLFHEVRLSMESREEETICLDGMTMGGAPQQENGSSLQVSMEKLLELLETASTYVNGVVDGSTPPDATLGRQIADTLAAVPRIRPEIFDKIFQDSLQDLLMVTYLSNITKTQLVIADKLNASI